MKTQNCEHCRHANYEEKSMRCGVGHKPRFYLPKHDMHGENWGYKRKCADHAPGTPDGLKPVEIISVANVMMSEPNPKNSNTMIAIQPIEKPATVGLVGSTALLGSVARPLRVLVACEYSGAVRDSFRAMGHHAWSCDLLPTDAPGLHYQGDVRHILDGWTPVRHQCECDPEGDGLCLLTDGDTSECPCLGPTQDEVEYLETEHGLFARPLETPGWDIMIAHPPCTYLCSSGLHWNKRRPERAGQTEDALAFVRLLLDAPIPYIALENPIGCISTRIRPPTQTIQPWQFGHPESKATCLWLKGLPPLAPTEIMAKPECGHWENQTPSGQNKLAPSADRWKIRSATYAGIARAMAAQWSAFLLPNVAISQPGQGATKPEL